MSFDHAPLRLREVFGLSPLSLRARETWIAVRGDASVPGTRVDLSTLGVLSPALSVRTWLGLRRPDRLVPVSNFFNRTPTPLSEGWSIRKRQVRDFRGGTQTYDSHNGTDLVLPVGTVVVAPAPARVLRVSSEYNRGGLKVFLDHGRGVVTTSNHLARALVRVGDLLERGEPMALSGYSGLDGLIVFPWSVPHVHFNVWLDGEYVDPFATAGETPLWREGNAARPAARAAEPFEPTEWDEAAVEATIRGCLDSEVRASLASERELAVRAMDVLFQRNYYPTRFADRPPLVRTEHAREPRLTLPVRADEWEGLAL